MAESTHSGEPASHGGEGTPSLVALLALLVRNRRLMIGLPLGVAAAAVLLSLVFGKRFTAESRILPEQESELPADIAGIAAQLGVSMANAGQSESVDFYAQLFDSNEILRETALTEYAFRTSDGEPVRGDLLVLYDIDGDSTEDRVKAAVNRLRDRDLEVELHRSANLLVLRTTAPWPALAEAVNRRMLELVNTFNLERRQSRAAQEQAFLESRVAAVAADLRAAETALQRFMTNNRRYSESPETSFEYGRLQREVDRLQQIHLSLSQGLEQARVEAVRNVPVITVVDRPEGTAVKTAPRILLNGVLGLILGTALALSILMGRQAMSAGREDYRELRAATAEALRDPLGLRKRGRQGEPEPGVPLPREAADEPIGERMAVRLPAAAAGRGEDR